MRLFAAVALVLFSCMGIIGATHQAGWLLTSGEPWLTARHKRILTRHSLQNLAHNLTRAGEEADWRSEATFRNLAAGATRQSIERAQLFSFQDGKGRLEFVIILLRGQDQPTEHFSVAVPREGKEESFETKAELHRWLEQRDPTQGWKQIPALR